MSASRPHGEDYQAGVETVHESLLSILINNASLVGPIIALRALYSFGNLIEHGPKGHVNCGLGPALLRAFFACFDKPSAELPKLTLR